MSRANLRTATALFILVLTANTLQAQVDVLTAQYNTSRTGSNTQETVLNQTNVNSLQFGKLFSRTVDAGFYASPLIATGVSIPGVGQRNVVYVATLGNTVYAFDADDPAVSNAYWSVNLGASIPRSAYYLGPNIGILGTPVIDRSTNTIYVAAIVRTIDDGLYVYALDLSTGAFKFNSPRRITFTFPSGVTKTIASQGGGSTWLQRAALLLSNGILYVATSNVWEVPNSIGSQEGFVQAFAANDLSNQLASFETTPSGLGGGIWQAGRGLAADASGNVFVAMDSGDYRPPSSFGDSVVKLSGGTLSPLSWFTPANWQFLYTQNLDLSANGVTLIPGTNLAFAGGKEGVIYLLDQTNLGGLQAAAGTNLLQQFQATVGCTANCAKHLSTAFWPRATNPRLFVWEVGDYLRTYPFDSAAQRFVPGAATVGTLLPSRPSGLSVSSNGSAPGTGIVWATTATQDPFSSLVPGTLRAYNADDITQELYSSDENSCRDAMGSFVKFAPPIVANGKVYVNTQSNVLNVYGLLPSGNSNTVYVRLNTAPSGLAVAVDGSACAESSGAPGSPHTIATSSPQAGAAGTQFVWNRWSDGGAISHSVAPTNDTTYTAHFTPQYLLTTNVLAGNVTTSPASATGHYDPGTSVQLTAMPVIPSCPFTSWNGAVSGTQNPQTVIVSGPANVTANFQCPSFLTGYALNAPAERNDFGGWVGMKFTVGSNAIRAVALGRLFLTGNVGTHPVKLVRASDGLDVPGGSVAIPMTGGARGQFSYVPLANPLTLQANTSYYLVSQEMNGGDKWYNFGTVSSGAGVVNNAIWLNGSAWTLSAANSSYVPVNFVFTTNVPSMPASATFVGTDATTQGNWRGVYGSEGYQVVGDSASASPYSIVTAGGASAWTWTAATSETRALQRASGNGRVAAAWYGQTFTLDVDVTDGAAHPFALYLMDWDTTARAQTVEVRDAVTNAVLDTRTATAFNGGQYWRWMIAGHVTIHVTKTAGFNAVVSGWFFGGPVGGTNVGPVVTLDTPAEGATAVAPATFALSATATDSDGIARVEFYQGTTQIGTPTGPTSATWSGVLSGSYTLTAKAYDTKGAATVSAPVHVTVTPPTGGPLTSATFLETDTATQGNWRTVYGGDGYQVVGDAGSAAPYATVTPRGNSSWTWSTATSDPRALQKTIGSGRVAAAWYGQTFSLDVTITDGNAHPFSLYLMDWDTAARVQTILVRDQVTNAVLDTRTANGFNGGQYWRWSIAGRVTITVTRTAGANAVVSGWFLGGAPPVTQPPATSATFVGTNTTLQGNWRGVYGSDGYQVVGDTVSAPPYAVVTPTGVSTWTWTGATGDSRALQRAAGSGRIAATWYGQTLTLDVTITDGNAHPFALYLLDWDTTTRAQTVEVRDAVTNALLDTRTVTGFNGGQYWRWTIGGHITIRVIRTGGANAVISGWFFGP